MRKNLMTIMVVITLTVISTNAEAFIRIQIGERVQIVNNLRHQVVITYSPMLGRSTSARFSPGQIGEISGVRGREYLIAQVFSSDGEIIGTSTYRVRRTIRSGNRPRSARTQIWRISSYRRLR